MRRKKLVLPINLHETTNSNRIKTGSGLTAYLYPGGAQIEAADASVVTGDVLTCSGRGDLAVGDSVIVVEDDGTTEKGPLSITAIEETGPGTGVYSFTVSNAGSPIAVFVGDRICAERTSGNHITIYEDETDDSDTTDTSSGLTVPANGLIQAFVGVNTVDVYVSGSGITAGWFAFNYPTTDGTVGPFVGKAETKTAAATLNIDADTSIMFVSGTTQIVDIEHCEDGRLVILIPTGSGVNLKTTATLGSGANNEVYTGSAGTLTLNQFRPVILVGITQGGGTQWLVSEALSSLGLDDLSDATVTGSPSNPSVLVSTGGAYTESQSIGSDAAPLTGLGLVAGNFRLVHSAGGAYITFDMSGVASNKTLTFVATASGDILTSGGTHTVDGTFTFEDLSFFIASSSGSTRKFGFDASPVTAGVTRTYTAANRDLDLDNVGKHRSIVVHGGFGAADGDGLALVLANENAFVLLRVPDDITIETIRFDVYNIVTAGAPDVQLSIYHGSTVPTATTAPPAGTAILSSSIDLSSVSSGARTQLLNASSFADATVPSGNYIYLSKYSGTTWPNMSRWVVQIDYTVD